MTIGVSRFIGGLKEALESACDVELCLLLEVDYSNESVNVHECRCRVKA